MRKRRKGRCPIGGGGTSVKQASTLTGEQKKLVTNYINALAPQLFQQTPIYNKKGAITGYKSGGFVTPETYQGERYAPVSPELLQMGQGALQNLSGGLEDVFSPIYQQAQNLWQQQIAPGVMERFAGMGAAMGGGAESALAREGQNLSTNLGAQLAPLWLQAQTALPGMAQQYSGWEQANRQAPLTVAQQQWGEQQPYSNPYLQMMGQILPNSGQYTSPYLSQSAPSFGSSLLTGLGTNLAGQLGSMNLLGSFGGGLGAATAAGGASSTAGAAAGAGSGLLGLLGGAGGGILSALGALI